MEMDNVKVSATVTIISRDRKALVLQRLPDGALGTQIEQYIVYGHIWDINQTFHHEVLSIGLITLGVGILIGGYLCKKKK